MSRKIYRDGVFFATGSSLEAITELTGEDVSRYSFDVDDLQAEAINTIDQAANRKRAEYITDILGQPTIYADKKDEAARYRADNADIGRYLQKTMNRSGRTADSIVTEWEGLASMWLDVSADIEAERTTGKDDVRSATDQAGVEAARASAVSAIEAL